MGKKIALAIFGGLAAIGILVMVVGFAMGGGVGGYTVRDGEFVYQTLNESVRLGRAPKGWENHWGTFSIGSISGWNETDPEAVSAAFGEARELPLPEGANHADRVRISISAGYLTVVQGETFSVKVNGPLECTAKMDGAGECKIESDYNTSRITSNPLNGKPRFYMDGKDVTTEYLVTLPAGCRAVDASQDMGVMTATGLNLEQGSFVINVGSMVLKDCAVQTCEISTDVGAATATGFAGTHCKLVVNVGGIDFQGSVSDTLEVDCDLGHVSATLPRPESYGEEVKVGLGSVTVDGHSLSGIDGSRSNNPSARPFFDLNCDLGSIEIVFESP